MMLGTFSLYLDVPYYHINIVITLITFVFIEVNLLYLSRIFSRQGLTILFDHHIAARLT
jgi:hypothetical protein